MTDLYWLGRVTLLSDREQVEAYDRLFRQIFRGTVELTEIDLRTTPAQPAVSMPSEDHAPGHPPPQPSWTRPGGSTGATPEDEADGDEQAPPSLPPGMNRENMFRVRSISRRSSRVRWRTGCRRSTCRG